MFGLADDQITATAQHSDRLVEHQGFVREGVVRVHDDLSALGLGDDFLADNENIARLDAARREVIGLAVKAGVDDLTSEIIAGPDFGQSRNGEDFKPSEHVPTVGPFCHLPCRIVGKQSRRERRNKPAIVTPTGDQGRSWFLPVVVLIVLAGGAAVGVLATQRESNADVAPRALVDHWHGALLIHNCGQDLPFATTDNDPDGVHTHGDGLMHVHPFNTSASGRNATLATYFTATQASLTDSMYIPGPSESPVVLDESVSCAGEDAELVLAFWEDPQSAEPPVVIKENLADFRIETDNYALTLALVPVGTDPADIPKSPLVNQIEQLGALDGG